MLRRTFAICLVLLVTGCVVGVQKRPSSHLVLKTRPYATAISQYGIEPIQVTPSFAMYGLFIDEKEFSDSLQSCLETNGVFSYSKEKYRIVAQPYEFESNYASGNHIVTFLVEYVIYAPNGEFLSRKTIKAQGVTSSREGYGGPFQVRYNLTHDRAVQLQLRQFSEYVISTVQKFENK